MKRADVVRLLDTLCLRDHEPSHTLDAWNEVNSAGLLELLRHEGAELWFYRRVKRLSQTVPPDVTAELRLAVQAASILNMRIDAQTIAVTVLLTSAGISWRLLKGQARRAAATLYPYADARRVSDVDLLVPEKQAQQAWQLLVDNGFRRFNDRAVNEATDHHLPTLIDANNVAVELHKTTSMSVTPEEAWKRATFNADVVQWSGMQTTVPSATELVWQALAHGAADGAEGYDLKAFLSVAAVLAPNPSIDWALLERRLNSNEVLDNNTACPVSTERTRRFFAVAAELAGVTLPVSLMPKQSARIGPLLQWRSMVLVRTQRRAVRDRLFEEATRVESPLPITPLVSDASVWPNVRRRVSSIIARAAYYLWRAWNARR